MAWFRRRPTQLGTYRVTAVTAAPSGVSVTVNGMPEPKLHISGLLTPDGAAAVAASFDIRVGIDRTPSVGDVLPAEVMNLEPLRVRVAWGASDDSLQKAAVQGDAQAQVLADLLSEGSVEQQAGQVNAVGYAATDADMAQKLAAQAAAALGTPISMDIDVGGVRKTIHVGGGGHLSSAEAAELLRTGVACTATIAGAMRVPVPAAMLGPPEASLWDLELDVRRADGSTYRTTTRTAYRTEARRSVLGVVGLAIPVRVDSSDDSRVAVDGATYDATHPGAPPG